jgi:hypothetical protein
VDCANYVIPVTIDNVVHNVFVIKRPGVDDFMRRVGEVYEVMSPRSHHMSTSPAAASASVLIIPLPFLHNVNPHLFFLYSTVALSLPSSPPPLLSGGGVHCLSK